MQQSLSRTKSVETSAVYKLSIRFKELSFLFSQKGCLTFELVTDHGIIQSKLKQPVALNGQKTKLNDVISAEVEVKYLQRKKVFEEKTIELVLIFHSEPESYIIATFPLHLSEFLNNGQMSCTVNISATRSSQKEGSLRLALSLEALPDNQARRATSPRRAPLESDELIALSQKRSYPYYSSGFQESKPLAKSPRQIAREIIQRNLPPGQPFLNEYDVDPLIKLIGHKAEANYKPQIPKPNTSSLFHESQALAKSCPVFFRDINYTDGKGSKYSCIKRLNIPALFLSEAIALMKSDQAHSNIQVISKEDSKTQPPFALTADLTTSMSNEELLKHNSLQNDIAKVALKASKNTSSENGVSASKQGSTSGADSQIHKKESSETQYITATESAFQDKAKKGVAPDPLHTSSKDKLNKPSGLNGSIEVKASNERSEESSKELINVQGDKIPGNSSPPNKTVSIDSPLLPAQRKQSPPSTPDLFATRKQNGSSNSTHNEPFAIKNSHAEYLASDREAQKDQVYLRNLKKRLQSEDSIDHIQKEQHESSNGSPNPRVEPKQSSKSPQHKLLADSDDSNPIRRLSDSNKLKLDKPRPDIRHSEEVSNSQPNKIIFTSFANKKNDFTGQNHQSSSLENRDSGAKDSIYLSKDYDERLVINTERSSINTPRFPLETLIEGEKEEDLKEPIEEFNEKSLVQVGQSLESLDRNKLGVDSAQAQADTAITKTSTAEEPRRQEVEIRFVEHKFPEDIATQELNTTETQREKETSSNLKLEDSKEQPSVQKVSKEVGTSQTSVSISLSAPSAKSSDQDYYNKEPLFVLTKDLLTVDTSRKLEGLLAIINKSTQIYITNDQSHLPKENLSNTNTTSYQNQKGDIKEVHSYNLVSFKDEDLLPEAKPKSSSEDALKPTKDIEQPISAEPNQFKKVSTKPEPESIEEEPVQAPVEQINCLLVEQPNNIAIASPMCGSSNPSMSMLTRASDSFNQESSISRFSQSIFSQIEEPSCKKLNEQSQIKSDQNQREEEKSLSLVNNKEIRSQIEPNVSENNSTTNSQLLEKDTKQSSDLTEKLEVKELKKDMKNLSKRNVSKLISTLGKKLKDRSTRREEEVPEAAFNEEAVDHLKKTIGSFLKDNSVSLQPAKQDRDDPSTIDEGKGFGGRSESGLEVTHESTSKQPDSEIETLNEKKDSQNEKSELEKNSKPNELTDSRENQTNITNVPENESNKKKMSEVKPTESENEEMKSELKFANDNSFDFNEKESREFEHGGEKTDFNLSKGMFKKPAKDLQGKSSKIQTVEEHISTATNDNQAECNEKLAQACELASTISTDNESTLGIEISKDQLITDSSQKTKDLDLLSTDSNNKSESSNTEHYKLFNKQPKETETEENVEGVDRGKEFLKKKEVDDAAFSEKEKDANEAVTQIESKQIKGSETSSKEQRVTSQKESAVSTQSEQSNSKEVQLKDESSSPKEPLVDEQTGEKKSATSLVVNDQPEENKLQANIQEELRVGGKSNEGELGQVSQSGEEPTKNEAQKELPVSIGLEEDTKQETLPKKDPMVHPSEEKKPLEEPKKELLVDEDSGQKTLPTKLREEAQEVALSKDKQSQENLERDLSTAIHPPETNTQESLEKEHQVIAESKENKQQNYLEKDTAVESGIEEEELREDSSKDGAVPIQSEEREKRENSQNQELLIQQLEQKKLNREVETESPLTGTTVETNLQKETEQKLPEANDTKEKMVQGESEMEQPKTTPSLDQSLPETAKKSHPPETQKKENTLQEDSEREDKVVLQPNEKEIIEKSEKVTQRTSNSSTNRLQKGSEKEPLMAPQSLDDNLKVITEKDQSGLVKPEDKSLLEKDEQVTSQAAEETPKEDVQTVPAGELRSEEKNLVENPQKEAAVINQSEEKTQQEISDKDSPIITQPIETKLPDDSPKELPEFHQAEEKNLLESLENDKCANVITQLEDKKAHDDLLSKASVSSQAEDRERGKQPKVDGKETEDSNFRHRDQLNVHSKKLQDEFESKKTEESKPLAIEEVAKQKIIDHESKEQQASSIGVSKDNKHSVEKEIKFGEKLHFEKEEAEISKEKSLAIGDERRDESQNRSEKETPQDGKRKDQDSQVEEVGQKREGKITEESSSKSVIEQKNDGGSSAENQTTDLPKIECKDRKENVETIESNEGVEHQTIKEKEALQVEKKPFRDLKSHNDEDKAEDLSLQNNVEEPDKECKPQREVEPQSEEELSDEEKAQQKEQPVLQIKQAIEVEKPKKIKSSEELHPDELLQDTFIIEQSLANDWLKELETKIFEQSNSSTALDNGLKVQVMQSNEDGNDIQRGEKDVKDFRVQAKEIGDKTSKTESLETLSKEMNSNSDKGVQKTSDVKVECGSAESGDSGSKETESSASNKPVAEQDEKYQNVFSSARHNSEITEERIHNTQSQEVHFSGAEPVNLNQMFSRKDHLNKDSTTHTPVPDLVEQPKDVSVQNVSESKEITTSIPKDNSNPSLNRTTTLDSVKEESIEAGSSSEKAHSLPSFKEVEELITKKENVEGSEIKEQKVVESPALQDTDHKPTKLDTDTPNPSACEMFLRKSSDRSGHHNIKSLVVHKSLPCLNTQDQGILNKSESRFLSVAKAMWPIAALLPYSNNFIPKMTHSVDPQGHQPSSDNVPLQNQDASGSTKQKHHFYTFVPLENLSKKVPKDELNAKEIEQDNYTFKAGDKKEHSSGFASKNLKVDRGLDKTQFSSEFPKNDVLNQDSPKKRLTIEDNSACNKANENNELIHSSCSLDSKKSAIKPLTSNENDQEGNPSQKISSTIAQHSIVFEPDMKGKKSNPPETFSHNLETGENPSQKASLVSIRESDNLENDFNTLKVNPDKIASNSNVLFIPSSFDLVSEQYINQLHDIDNLSPRCDDLPEETSNVIDTFSNYYLKATELNASKRSTDQLFVTQSKPSSLSHKLKKAMSVGGRLLSNEFLFGDQSPLLKKNRSKSKFKEETEVTEVLTNDPPCKPLPKELSISSELIEHASEKKLHQNKAQVIITDRIENIVPSALQLSSQNELIALDENKSSLSPKLEDSNRDHSNSNNSFRQGKRMFKTYHSVEFPPKDSNTAMIEESPFNHPLLFITKTYSYCFVPRRIKKELRCWFFHILINKKSTIPHKKRSMFRSSSFTLESRRPPTTICDTTQFSYSLKPEEARGSHGRTETTDMYRNRKKQKSRVALSQELIDLKLENKFLKKVSVEVRHDQTHPKAFQGKDNFEDKQSSRTHIKNIQQCCIHEGKLDKALEVIKKIENYALTSKEISKEELLKLIQFSK